MRSAAYLAFSTVMAMFSTIAWAEQGCPPGQIPAQSNGSMMSCGPIPPGYYQEQQAPASRPSGKWIKTWGAIASDDAGTFGVSTGKLKKLDAEQEALGKCEGESQKDCHVIRAYENQCVAIAEPDHRGSVIWSISHGPSAENTKKDAISDCQKKNPGSECKIIYTACTEPVFQEF